MDRDQKTALDHWVKRLGSVDLPAMSGVMQDLNRVTQADASSAQHLAEIILKDASLTAKVLRIANSVYHRGGSQSQITTISRAVVQLGFKGIKAISLSVMLVDSLLKKGNRDRMLEWMGRGFHAGVQAQDLIGKEMDDRGEDAFITALLLHMGEMAFWTSNDKATKKLDEALAPSSTGDSDVESQVLGTDFKALSVALADAWNMSPEIHEAMSPGHHPSRMTQAVLLGEAISFAAEQGWQSDAFGDVLVKASLFTGRSLEDMRAQIMSNAEKAASVAVTYGAHKVCQFIPSTVESDTPVPEAVWSAHADPQLQLDVLREMASMVSQNVDINTLFTLVMEGIQRGIGLERVALALIDPKVTSMQAKYVLGEKAEEWRDEMKFPVKSEQDNLFAYCLHKRKPIWLRKDRDMTLQHLVSRRIERLIDAENAIMAAIYAGTRPIGVFVADKGPEGNAIDQEQFDSFCHFAQQTSQSLAMLAAQRANKAG